MSDNLRISSTKIKRILYFFAINMLIFTNLPINNHASASSAEVGNLTITLENIMPDQNYMTLYLCNAQQFLAQPCPYTLMKQANQTKTTFYLENAPAGEWSVVMFHDQDNDGKMKRGLIFPKEGYGFSVMRGKILGKPNFKNAKFTIIPNQENSVSILLRY